MTSINWNCVVALRSNHTLLPLSTSWPPCLAFSAGRDCFRESASFACEDKNRSLHLTRQHHKNFPNFAFKLRWNYDGTKERPRFHSSMWEKQVTSGRKNKSIRPLWELNHIFMKMMKKNYSIDHQHCHVISYQEQLCALFLKAMKTSDQFVQVFIIISPFEPSYVQETSQP